ncbi:dihydropteroate synthase [Streptomyces massasporeus]|uniref:Dihydropteroate synthase n=1 Tax=Streptomyces massasporeus TaxID=67324 RepID=A0ABW6LJL5_9ACTN
MPRGRPRRGRHRRRRRAPGKSRRGPERRSPAGLSRRPPGTGIRATRVERNWRLLGDLREATAALGRPVLVGVARKAFPGHLLRDPETGRPRPAHPRDTVTSAVSVPAAALGAWCVRVHGVASTADAVRVTARWVPCDAPTPPSAPRF